jgi:hypothetical protein
MKKFYNIISMVFQPLLIPTYGVAMLVSLPDFNDIILTKRVMSVIGTLLFTGIVPAIPIGIMLKRGEVHDVFISRRKERTRPYIYALLSYLLWTYFLWKVLALPSFIVWIGIGGTAAIIIIIAINFFWKISAHLASMGALTGGVFGVSYLLAYNSVWILAGILLLSALVTVSRLELKAHTPFQTLAGFALGFLLIFLPCLWV